jgi:hypothetical protein
MLKSLPLRIDIGGSGALAEVVASRKTAPPVQGFE